MASVFFIRRINMLLQDITKRVNNKLAGETLTYSQMKDHLDSVIDDINSELNSIFPAFSELEDTVIDYNFFPERYIRQVVVSGAAVYFYGTDEEGEMVASQFQADYQRCLFYMIRDYSHLVPEDYRNDDTTGGIDFAVEEETGVRGVEIDGSNFIL
jgi:hypothetical protein